MRDITTDNLVGILREGKLEGEAEFIGHVSVFSGAEASSLFLTYYSDHKLSLTSLGNKKYKISSSDREKKQFRLNFLMKDDKFDYEMRTGSIGMKMALPERNDIGGFFLRLDNVRDVRY